MTNFVTIAVRSVRAREKVEELVVNGVPVLQVFEARLRGTTYWGKYAAMLKYIEYAANGHSLPVTKFRFYGRGHGEVAEYEFKSKHLRIWAIQQPCRKIIVLGGFKNSQQQDERKFRELKEQYLRSLKQGR